MGWQHPVRPTPWDQIDDRFAELASAHPALENMSEIVRSVRTVGAERDLAAFTSMHDLMVVSRPISEPPIAVVAVRAPSSLTKVSDGCVLIEHLSITGRNDRIERPTPEVVPLFWRFVIEKFGVDPQRYA